MSKHVVILGGGIGSLATAYNLRKMDKSLRITVVSGRPYFGFTPSYPHLALGWRKFEDISIPLGSLLPKHGIEYVPENGERIDPDANKLWTTSGKEIEYDYLVIATGPKLVFGAEGQEQNSTSVCTAEHALQLQKKLEGFYKNLGPVVIGAIPGVSRFGPAYEFAFMLHYELKKRRNKTQGAHNFYHFGALRGSSGAWWCRTFKKSNGGPFCGKEHKMDCQREDHQGGTRQGNLRGPKRQHLRGAL